MVTTRKMKTRVTTPFHLLPPPVPESLVMKKFFTIVLPSTMKRNMMKIPTRFVRLQGSKLFEAVKLETPVGFKRLIKLKRIGEEIWFEKGWKEFAEAHCIKEGHFLMFEYKGNSSFRVIIFDVNACEIEYPLDVVHIIDSDDEAMEVTNKGRMENGESVNANSDLIPKKIDIEFEKILNDLDSTKVFEDAEDKRDFKGKTSSLT